MTRQLQLTNKIMGKGAFITLEIEGRSDKAAIQRLRAIDKKFERDLGLLVIATANNIADDTKSPANFPYRTGFLKGSYHADTRGAMRTLSAVAGSFAAYAPNVEYGYGQKPQPFFGPAAALHHERFYKDIETLIRHFDKQ